MSDNLREPDGGPAAPTPEDELAARITSALRSRGGPGVFVAGSCGCGEVGLWFGLLWFW